MLKTKLGTWRPLLSLLLACLATSALADPAIIASADATIDAFQNTTGGLQQGGETLIKLRFDLAIDASSINPGLTGGIEVFHTEDGQLSGSRAGDLQTASNIEAPRFDRLSQAWVQQSWGDSFSIRLGLQDLNMEFDAIESASMMVNSSHGVGPDISSSGSNGPSIFPTMGLAARLAWSPTSALAMRLAAFDAAPGNADHPGRFADFTVNRREGALIIGQADWTIAPSTQLSVGAWSYTAKTAAIDPLTVASRQAGVFGFITGPVPVHPRLTGWLRGGIANGDTQTVSAYLGAGLVMAGPFASRADDSLGLAIASAQIGGPSRRLQGLPNRETTFELTYGAALTPWLTLQPDLQYISHPASVPGLDDALLVGLRVILSGSHRVP